MNVASISFAVVSAFTGPELQPIGTEETCSGDPSLAFIEPADGAMLESPITVSYVLGQACYCDTGGCTDEDFESARLSANGQDYPLTGDPIQLDLPAGEHTLTLIGEGFLIEESVAITITILAGSETSGQGSETTGGSPSGSSSSCAVVDPSERSAGVLALGFVLIGFRRGARARAH